MGEKQNETKRTLCLDALPISLTSGFEVGVSVEVPEPSSRGCRSGHFFVISGGYPDYVFGELQLENALWGRSRPEFFYNFLKHIAQSGFKEQVVFRMFDEVLLC